MHIGQITVGTDRPCRIWIFCPAGRVTGGPEALHQLCHALTEAAMDAKMVYLPLSPEGHATPAAYAHYNTATAALDDQTGDIAIIPESCTEDIKSIRHARVMIWWLSVDNFFHYYGPVFTLKKWVKRLIRYHRPPVFDLSDARKCGNLTQSDYARRFLARRLIKSAMLTDYVADPFRYRINAAQDRRKDEIVVFNPVKGYEFTAKLIEAAAGSIRFVPLSGLTAEQAADLLARAKLYIDFGHHPGRDRIPREAALAGCCILVRRAGSAAYQSDMPIPEAYKLRLNQFTNYKKLAGTIQAMLVSYDTRTVDFAAYRQWISKQKDVFHAEVYGRFIHTGAYETRR